MKKLILASALFCSCSNQESQQSTLNIEVHFKDGGIKLFNLKCRHGVRLLDACVVYNSDHEAIACNVNYFTIIK